MEKMIRGRKKTMMHCILDASVAVKWFFREEELTQQADILLNSDISFIVPDYFFLEMNSVLSKLSRKGLLTVREVQQMIRALGALPVDVLESALYRDLALDLALEKKIGYYDCLYLIPAQITQIPLITADVRLYRTFAGTKYGEYVQWLGDYQ